MKKILLAAAFFFCSATNTVFSQSFAINTDGNTANASALLDVKSTLKGMLIPRMSRTERNAITAPATGLLIFQNAPDSIGFYYYNGTAWTWMLSNANSDLLAWRTGGNTGTLDASHFIGTTDNVPLSIKVNNLLSGRIDQNLSNSFWGYRAGLITTGAYNSFFGGFAGNVNSSGYQNSFFGNSAGTFNTTGYYNSFFGSTAGSSNNSGYGNSFFGVASGYANTTGIYNIFIGMQTGRNTISGSNNTIIGSEALNTNTVGYSNVAVGVKTLYSTISTNNLVAVGDSSLLNNTGAGNTAVGSKSMYANTTAGKNTAIGYQALYSQAFSNSNTAWSSENVAIGDSALYANQPTAISNGNQNTAVGNRTLRTNTIGWQNTAMGNLSLFSNTIGQLNTANGWASLYKNDEGYYNTALGAMAMYYNTTGGYNVGVGTVSLHHNLTGSGNTAVGQQAGLGTMGNSFSNNTIIGYQSGYNLTTGSNNVFLGTQAGYNVTSGSNKLYIANSSVDPPLVYGDFASAAVGLGTITPSEKLEINGNLKFTGASTIYSNTGTALTIRPGDGTGSGGILTVRGGNAGVTSGGAGGDLNLNAGANLPAGGIGYSGLGAPGKVNINGSSGYNSVGGGVNIIAGATSCWSLVSGSHSDVAIQGGQNLAVTDAGSIMVQGGYTIGTTCPPPGATGGNIIIQSGLGSGTGSNGTIQLMNGNVGIGTSAPSSKLEVCGNVRVIGTIVASGTITTSAISCPSDLRYKKNITPLTGATEKLMQVNAVRYNWRREEFPNMSFNNKLQTGFIAQDLEKIFPEMVFTDDTGYKSIDYSRLTPVLVETIREQQTQIAEIRKRLHEIEKMLAK